MMILAIDFLLKMLYIMSMNLLYNTLTLIPEDDSIREDCTLVGSASAGISF
jgi:hypothetical protein